MYMNKKTLFCLHVCQNVAVSIVGKAYDTVDMTLMTCTSEIIKLCVSWAYVAAHTSDALTTRDALTYFPIAVGYATQSLCISHAIKFLDVPLFQVLQQSKTLQIAGILTLFTNTSISSHGWCILVTIFFCMLLATHTHQEGALLQRQLYGILLTCVGTLCSSIVSVVFENLLTRSRLHAMTVNVHLSLVAILISVVTAVVTGCRMDVDVQVVVLSALHATGGLIVANVTRECGSLLKSIASALSFVITCVLSHVMFAATLTAINMIGCFLTVALSTYYSLNADAMQKSLSLPTTRRYREI